MANRATRWLSRIALLAGVVAWAGGFAGVARAGLPSATTATAPAASTSPTTATAATTAPATQAVATTTETVAASAASDVQQTVSGPPTATVQQVAAATETTVTSAASATTSTVGTTGDGAAQALEAAATTVSHAAPASAPAVDTVTKLDAQSPTAARPSAPSPRPATSTAPTARQLPQSGMAGTIASSSSSRQRPVSRTRVRTSQVAHATRPAFPSSGVVLRIAVAPAAHSTVSPDSKQRTPLPQQPPGSGLVSGASGEGGAAPPLFALSSFLLLLAIPTAVRWLRSAEALGLTPAYVALRDRPG